MIPGCLLLCFALICLLFHCLLSVLPSFHLLTFLLIPSQHPFSCCGKLLCFSAALCSLPFLREELCNNWEYLPCRKPIIRWSEHVPFSVMPKGWCLHHAGGDHIHLPQDLCSPLIQNFMVFFPPPPSHIPSFLLYAFCLAIFTNSLCIILIYLSFVFLAH